MFSVEIPRCKKCTENPGRDLVLWINDYSVCLKAETSPPWGLCILYREHVPTGGRTKTGFQTSQAKGTDLILNLHTLRTGMDSLPFWKILNAVHNISPQFNSELLECFLSLAFFQEAVISGSTQTHSFRKRLYGSLTLLGQAFSMANSFCATHKHPYNRSSRSQIWMVFY